MPDNTQSSRPPDRPAVSPYPQTSGLAVAALIVSIFGISIVGLILGILALQKINRSQGRLTGRGLAIASIILSGLSLVVFALVLLLLFFSFFGGWAVWSMVQPIQSEDPVAAYYGQQEEIRISDLHQARMDLELLRALEVERAAGVVDFNAGLLMQVLFGNPDTAAYLEKQIRRAAGQGYIDTSPVEINAFFEDPRIDPAFYWILLVAEAKTAGCTVSQEQAESFLKQFLSTLPLQAANPMQMVETLAAKQQVTSQKIIQTFADLLTILQYANQAAAGEILTAEYIQFDAMKLVEEQPYPTDVAFAAQFETYKESPAGQIRPDNPYGFGYLLPKKVQLDYILIENTEVLKQVAYPTSEDLEEYYARNIRQFERSVLSDPNNPNSQTISRILPLADVSYQIERTLMNTAVRKKTDILMARIRELAETGSSTTAQTGDFEQIAKALSQEYNLPFLTGSTGMVDREGLLGNEQVGNLFLESSYGRYIPIDQWAFALPAEASEYRSKIELLINDSKRAAVRISRVQLPQAASLQSLDSPEISQIRNQVIQDCKFRSAMEEAKRRAAKFAQKVTENGWQKTIEEYNLQSEDKISLTSTSKRRYFSQPTQAEIIPLTQPGPLELRQERIRAQDRKLADSLYALIPSGQMQAADIAEAICPESCTSCYVVRSVSRKTVTMEDVARGNVENQELHLEISGTQGFGVIHFRPQNILKRMNYKTAAVEISGTPKEAIPSMPTSKQ